jgi:hypothetical protein
METAMYIMSVKRSRQKSVIEGVELFHDIFNRNGVEYFNSCLRKKLISQSYYRAKMEFERLIRVVLQRTSERGK